MTRDGGALPAEPARRVPRWMQAALGTGFFLLAALVVHGELRSVTWAEVDAAAAAVAPSALLTALACAALGLLATSAYDALSFAAIGQAGRGWRETRAVSLLSFALAHGGGLGLLAAGALRFRAYPAIGASPADIVRVSVLSSVTALIGGVALIGLGLSGLHRAAAAVHMPQPLAVALGAAALLGLGVYVLAPRRLGPAALPPRAVAAGQIVLSLLEWTTSAGILFAVLPPDTRGSLLPFLPVFGVAGLLGAASGLPGGVGVFDAVMLASLSGRVGGADVAAALVLYRLIYAVAPLTLAAAAVVVQSAPLPFRGEAPLDRLGREVLKGAAPAIFGVLVFASGVVMLASAATPALADRLRLLSVLAPTALVEGSHFVASLAGAALLFLAFGIANRLRRAHSAVLVVLIVGAVAALAKGLDYEEALFLSAIAGLLFASRAAFYRGGDLRTTPLRPGAIASVLLTLAAAAWLALFAFQHVAYRDELWWTFLIDQGAPRVLRAFVGVAALTVFIFVWRLATHAPTPLQPGGRQELSRVAAVIDGAENPSPDAYLAYLGDKRLLFSESGRSFVQYAVRGRNWIALGEPVGRKSERAAMIWAFREACDRAGSRPVFYAIPRDSVADFADCGLVASKIGENAIVNLAGFSLEGSKRAELRQARNRGLREGLTFQILPPDAFDDVAARLRAVSDEWLGAHQGEEKGFSLGRFDPDYLRRFPMAIVRSGGEIVAFANLLGPPDGGTLSVDLMRHGREAPKGAMDFLFIELLLWARAEGYARFDFGMAPLSGLDDHRLARAVTHIGALVYAGAGRFYGFEGLRAYKAKFAPRWEASYIAGPAAWILPSALGDAALLSSGGLLGLLR